MARSETQVGIVGAGPAGLMLSHLLHLHGISSIVLEARSRAYCEERVRAGVLEHTSVELLRNAGLSERLNREGLQHHGIDIGVDGIRHNISFLELTGKCVTVYGQQEVVNDLIARRFADNGDLRFECGDVTLHDIEGPQPLIRTNKNGNFDEIRCDYIAGCDGFHGISRFAVPAGALTVYERNYPFAWLGILAEASPSRDELLYMHHDRGFALYSMRSTRITRLYLQCAPNENIDSWSDDRIWNELRIRLGCTDGWLPAEGPILQKSVTGMRSFVVEPLQYGCLFLAGDAAHIVPPTGAKGMNLAFADVYYLSEALDAHYRQNSDEQLRQYSSKCLARIWKAQRFSWWMTSMLHRFHDESGFDHKRQLAELSYVTTSRAAATSLAENYVGLPLYT
ncbi:4-hydroxybenzoate 3-monooxygenase [Occallatibacter riparius]|uniref:4-hydroxybenzoate 3-monooxygenase n=1 Tax=Occallatibacter riparius TaxID=1002689 RepID=A0A9J7BSD7_9BACT|nr:4-hydroxybenzoate 3-monooxygenase [Occallatibacter riparius]UWZ85576.1 4-hydroxybenzoate 3-monooxygenase [Occallatibacter riparius]